MDALVADPHAGFLVSYLGVGDRVYETYPDRRPIAQWSRIKAGRNDDLARRLVTIRRSAVTEEE